MPLRIGHVHHHPLAVLTGQGVFHSHATVELGIAFGMKENRRIGHIFIKGHGRGVDVQILQLESGVFLKAV